MGEKIRARRVGKATACPFCKDDLGSDFLHHCECFNRDIHLECALLFRDPGCSCRDALIESTTEETLLSARRARMGPREVIDLGELAEAAEGDPILVQLIEAHRQDRGAREQLSSYLRDVLGRQDIEQESLLRRYSRDREDWERQRTFLIKVISALGGLIMVLIAILFTGKI